MNKVILLIPLLSMTLVACDRPDHRPRGEYFTEVEAGDEITPDKQSENEKDRIITQNIRRAIIADDELSMNGKNIKIITIGGTVTLRGIVENNQERDSIEKKALTVSGVQNIDNQLDVKTDLGASYYR